MTSDGSITLPPSKDDTTQMAAYTSKRTAMPRPTSGLGRLQHNPSNNGHIVALRSRPLALRLDHPEPGGTQGRSPFTSCFSDAVAGLPPVPTTRTGSPSASPSGGAV